MYPTGAVSPKYYGLPKIHKPGIPLRPIISSTGTVTYNTAKELAKILKPLVGLSSHHVHNTRDCIDAFIKDVRLRSGMNASIQSLVLWTWWLDNPTNGFKILANSFAVLYVTVPVLEIMGLSGMPGLWILGSP